MSDQHFNLGAFVQARPGAREQAPVCGPAHSASDFDPIPFRLTERGEHALASLDQPIPYRLTERGAR